MPESNNSSSLALTGLLVGVVVPLFLFALGAGMGRLFGWTRQSRQRRLVVIVPLLVLYSFLAYSAYMQSGFGWRPVLILVAGAYWASVAWSRGLGLPAGTERAPQAR